MTTGRDPHAGEEDLERLESEIQRTRSAIGRDIGTLGDKLTPEHLKEDAREALSDVKDAGIQKVREVKDRAVEAASETAQAAGERAKELGTTSLEFVQRNALPLGMIGLGIGLMARNLRSVSRSRRYGWRTDVPREIETPAAGERQENVGARISGKARELEQRMEHRAGSMRVDAQQGLERVERKAQQITNENPLATGAAAIVAGVGVGLLVPMSRRENELMGNMRDRLAGEAQSTFGRVQSAVKDTAHDVRGALSDTVHH